MGEFIYYDQGDPREEYMALLSVWHGGLSHQVYCIFDFRRKRIPCYNRLYNTPKNSLKIYLKQKKLWIYSR